MSDHFFVIKSARGPWGDYGTVLRHGMGSHVPRRDGVIQLARTAPFIPPVTIPGVGQVVLTEPAMTTIRAVGLTGAKFRPVHKAHIVELRWESWDQSLALPPVSPPSGEPGSYILDRPHDEAAAQALGNLYELVADEWGEGWSERSGVRNYKYFFNPGAGEAPDLFLADGLRLLFASERARALIEPMAVPYIEFVQTLPGTN